MIDADKLIKAKQWIHCTDVDEKVICDQACVSCEANAVEVLKDILEENNILKGIIAADDERLRIAAERVDLDFDCDTPDTMADEILNLRRMNK